MGLKIKKKKNDIFWSFSPIKYELFHGQKKNDIGVGGWGKKPEKLPGALLSKYVSYTHPETIFI